MLVRQVALWLVAWMFAVGAAGAPVEPDATFERRVWTPVEGAPASAWDIAQSADGLLWFASPAGLYRFDGEKFQRIDSIYGHALASHNINLVVALKQGIAVAYSFGGISVFTPQGVKHYDKRNGLPNGTIGELVQTADGTLYAATWAGLARLDGDTWTILRGNGLPDGTVRTIALDRSGALWALINDQLFGRPAQGVRFEHVLDVTPGSAPQTVRGLVTALTRQGGAVQLALGKAPLPILDKVSATFDGVYEGPLASLWAWLGDRGGLVRLRRQGNGRYAVAESYENRQASTNTVISSLVDRDGNAWFATLNGIERFRAQRIHEVPLPDGTFMPYVHRGLGDAMLLSGLYARQVSRITAAGNAPAADLSDVVAMWRDSPDSLWAGSPAGLFHLRARGVERWPLPPEVKPGRTVQSIAVDRAGTVWVSISRTCLYRFERGRWTCVDTSALGNDEVPIILGVSGAGQLWFGLTNNRLGEIVDGKARAIPTSADSDIGGVLSLIEIGGRRVAGGENGLVWIDPRGNQAMRPEHEKNLRGVSGMALDRQGDLWAHGLDGIYRIPKAELDRFWADPAHRLKWEMFSMADGVRGAATQVRPLPSLTVAADGRVFYATTSQVGWIDPLNIRRNKRVPNVLVLGLRAGETELQPRGPVTLAAGTTALEIKYAVTAMSIPEKVKIRYRLSGVDRDWQEPRGERVARYTNLDPGSYTFQVIAANEDGVWNTEGARLQLEILPEFWQATWFRMLVLALLMAIVLAFYRWRIASVAARAAERTAARLEERERIARSLHDNLLQGVHTLMLRSGAVLQRLPKGSQEGKILEDALGQAEKLVEHTRDEVMALRLSQPASQIVAELRAELEAMRATSGARLTLSIGDGAARLRPEVAQEIRHVLREAVINAVRHAGATRIDVSLTVAAHGVQGEVLDDGAGMAPEVAAAGRPGHWGIVGMRERMTRLGGTLSIESNGGAGTVLRFNLPPSVSLD